MYGFGGHGGKGIGRLIAEQLDGVREGGEEEEEEAKEVVGGLGSLSRESPAGVDCCASEKTKAIMADLL